MKHLIVLLGCLLIFSCVPPAGAVGRGGYVSLSFDLLAGFDYEAHPRIPANIKLLNGRLVRLEGFMLAFEYNPAGVHSFALIKDRTACCYGATPRMNDWVMVEMANGGRVPIIKDMPIEASGRFIVGTKKSSADINGQVICIYQMVADEVQELQ